MGSKYNNGMKADIATLLKSIFFKTAVNTARNVSGKPGKALSIAALAAARLAQSGNKGGITNLKDSLLLLIGMIRAVARKQYNIPAATLIKALSAVIYFVFVVDAIPDFIPALGLLDDLAVVGWVMNSIEKDLGKFKKWHEESAALTEA